MKFSTLIRGCLFQFYHFGGNVKGKFVHIHPPTHTHTHKWGQLRKKVGKWKEMGTPWWENIQILDRERCVHWGGE